MNTPKKRRQLAWRARGVAKHMGMLGAVLLMSSAAQLSAQSDPTTIGAGQRPFVIMVVDSSASMDFSLEGEQKFPCYSNLQDPNDSNSSESEPCDVAATKPGNQPSGADDLFTWLPGETLGDSNNSFVDEGQSWNQKDHENPNVGPAYVGPCMVWKDACSEYSRPSWSPGLLDSPSGVASGTAAHQPNRTDQYDPRMWERLRSMRGRQVGFNVANGPGQWGPNPSRRLRDDNQPRHVQIKEILTGDMILEPNDMLPGASGSVPLNPEFYGPGCWFVPRMSGAQGAKAQWHACADVEPASPTTFKLKDCVDNSECTGGQCVVR